MGFITLTEARAFVREHFNPVPKPDITFHADCDERPCPHYTLDAKGCLRELPDSD